jgi:two-component system, cell cycle sensor histidine kinase and response regulator CckA
MAIELATSFTRQLLTLGRKQAAQLRPLDLNAAIKDFSRMIKRVIRENIRFYCEADLKSACVCADLAMLEQLVLNLVINARDAMPDGGELRLTIEKACPKETPTQSEEFYVLAVSDTGTGIAPEHIPHIFEPFFTTKSPGKGTGLGLSTVYGIVKQHNGRVEVASHPGVGTTFKIFLPAIPAAAIEQSPPLTLESPVISGTETILLVEDDSSVRNLERRLLEKHGYKVHEAASGEEALSIWKNLAGKVDLLLTDMVMPGMTGLDLTRRIRAENPRLVVILMSGYSADLVSANMDFINQTVTCFLPKPSPVADILQTVRQCLDKQLH